MIQKYVQECTGAVADSIQYWSCIYTAQSTDLPNEYLSVVIAKLQRLLNLKKNIQLRNMYQNKN